tara:strand:+ start:248 stop:769 length:522 start_codon:yes stop_codon:yes gene_type:complete
VSLKFKFTLLFFFLIFCFLIFLKSLNDSSQYTPKALINKKIPNFEIPELNSKKLISENNIFENNKTTLINIWASWCSPCREEHKYLIKLKEKKNLKIIGINYKDKKINATNFLKKLGNPYEIILVDKDGKNSINLGAYGVPETFIYDSNKKLMKKIIGPINLNSFNEIQNIIK